MRESVVRVELSRQIDRSSASNGGTRVAAFRRAAPTVGETFNSVQRVMRLLVLERRKPGLLVTAAHPELGIAGSAWVPVDGDLRSISVGRHGSTDLFLPFDEELSLRHLLVLARRDGDSARTRVVELASSSGLEDEHGDVLAGCEVDGFIGLRAAGFTLFLCPTGGALPWDSEATDPWSTLPERRYLYRLAPAQRRPVLTRPSPSGLTQVGRVEAPLAAGSESLRCQGKTVGYVALSQGEQEMWLPVADGALHRGVVLGRYARCHGAQLIADNTVSRVHLLVVKSGAELFAVDLGSTNGTWVSGAAIRCRAMHPGERFLLGLKGTTVRWEPVQ